VRLFRSRSDRTVSGGVLLHEPKAPYDAALGDTLDLSQADVDPESIEVYVWQDARDPDSGRVVLTRGKHYEVLESGTSAEPPKIRFFAVPADKSVVPTLPENHYQVEVYYSLLPGEYDFDLSQVDYHVSLGLWDGFLQTYFSRSRTSQDLEEGAYLRGMVAPLVKRTKGGVSLGGRPFRSGLVLRRDVLQKERRVDREIFSVFDYSWSFGALAVHPYCRLARLEVLDRVVDGTPIPAYDVRRTTARLALTYTLADSGLRLGCSALETKSVGRESWRARRYRVDVTAPHLPFDLQATYSLLVGEDERTGLPELELVTDTYSGVVSVRGEEYLGNNYEKKNVSHTFNVIKYWPDYHFNIKLSGRYANDIYNSIKYAENSSVTSWNKKTYSLDFSGGLSYGMVTVSLGANYSNSRNNSNDTSDASDDFSAYLNIYRKLL